MICTCFGIPVAGIIHCANCINGFTIMLLHPHNDAFNRSGIRLSGNFSVHSRH